LVVKSLCSTCSFHSSCLKYAGKDSINVKEAIEEYTIAVAGNPNVGKSTLFNILTGGRQRVGNWPGKTVERKEGERIVGNVRLKFIDLPGTYSLSALSLEEIVARRFIVEAKPNAVINIVDASNLERNLYLTIQILELTSNVIVALNMMDLAELKGIEVGVKRLSENLGVPVIPMIAVRGVGAEELIEMVLKVAKGEIKCGGVKVDYGREIENAINQIVKMLVEGRIASQLPYPARWIAIRLLEGDREVVREVLKINDNVITKVEELRRNLSNALGDDVDVIIADRRYNFIEKIVKDAVKRTGVAPITITDKIDRIVLNRFLGLPILIGVFSLLFIVVFSINIGFPLNLLMPEFEEFNLASLIGDRIFGYISDAASSYLTSIGAPSWLVSLVSDGIIAGVGAVLSFYPLIFTVFILFGILEDCGYMARAAFIMDRVMRRFGLNGKAFMPLMLGYGCNIPSITATRILHSYRDRLLAILLSSLIPCQARLAAFTIIVAAVFASLTSQVLVMLSLYVLSLALLVLVGSLFNKAIFREEPSTLILELPPYHKPSPRVVFWHAEERSKHFIIKAGTIILGVSILMWILTSYGPVGAVSSPEESFAAIIGRVLSPLLRPIGLGDWKVVVALLTGFLAKEAVPESLAIISGVNDPIQAVRVIGLTPLKAYSMLIFMMLYVPCLATLAAIYRETGSIKWTIIAVAYLLLLAYFSSLLLFSIGSVMGFN